MVAAAPRKLPSRSASSPSCRRCSPLSRWNGSTGTWLRPPERSGPPSPATIPSTSTTGETQPAFRKTRSLKRRSTSDPFARIPATSTSNPPNRRAGARGEAACISGDVLGERPGAVALDVHRDELVGGGRQHAPGRHWLHGPPPAHVLAREKSVR